MSDPQHIVAVAGAFFNDQGQILLVRTERRGWKCPGGPVEEGEDLISAVVREVKEETGCGVEVERLVGVYTNPVPPSNASMNEPGADPQIGAYVATTLYRDLGMPAVAPALLQKCRADLEVRILCRRSQQCPCRPACRRYLAGGTEPTA